MSRSLLVPTKLLFLHVIHVLVRHLPRALHAPFALVLLFRGLQDSSLLSTRWDSAQDPLPASLPR